MMDNFTAEQKYELQYLGVTTVGGKTYEDILDRFYIDTKTGTASDSYVEGAYSTVNGILVLDKDANTVTLTGEYIKNWSTGERVTYVTASASIEDYYRNGKLKLI